MLTEQGDWKIGGFGFGVSTKPEDGKDSEYEFPEYDARLPKSVQRNLDFLGTRGTGLLLIVAPEYVIDEKVDNPCDMYIYSAINF
jgi:hypothetical protein